MQQNPGLPHDCVTLTQRYDLSKINEQCVAPAAGHRHPLCTHACSSRLDRVEPVDPASKKAVVLTLHRMSGGLKADQALAFRAMAAEVQEAGYHFWILLHMVRCLAAWLSWAQLTCPDQFQACMQAIHLSRAGKPSGCCHTSCTGAACTPAAGCSPWLA